MLISVINIWVIAPMMPLLAAGEATPTSNLCIAEPVTRERIDIVLASPVAATPLPVAMAIVGGAPVSQDIEEEIAETVESIITCFNAGEPLRAWSYYSNSYLRQVASDAPLLFVELATPPADGPTVILAIENVRTLPDDRVIATVRLDPALIPVEKQFFFIFTRDGEQWLLDDVIDELDLAFP